MTRHPVTLIKSGARRTVLVSAGVVRDANGRPVHSASVQVDITELRQAEREVLKLNEAVAHRDRVASMAEMAAALAHEVRQPLTALISNAEAAAQFLDTPEPDLGEARSALAEIIADGNRVNAVVRNLRGIFQKQAAPGRVLDVNQVVRDLGRLAQKQLVVRGTHLTLDLSPEPVPVLAEENLLQQVIVNLMNNALDAMEAQPAHTRSLAIRTTIAPAANAGVIRVVDSGPGVPEEEVPEAVRPLPHHQAGRSRHGALRVPEHRAVARRTHRVRGRRGTRRGVPGRVPSVAEPRPRLRPGGLAPERGLRLEPRTWTSSERRSTVCRNIASSSPSRTANAVPNPLDWPSEIPLLTPFPASAMISSRAASTASS